MCYAQYALQHPERLKVVALAEPDPVRRSKAAQVHSVPPERCFDSYEQMLARPKLADAVINGTMDRLHYESSVAVLRAGYHMLLEKPIAPTEQEVRDLIALARQEQRTVMICHVLRYSPFYATVKEIVSSGRIGEIVSLRTEEAVSYHHLAVAFVRGKWNRSDETTPVLLAKCCHDFDLIAWLMAGVEPLSVASFGSLKQFRPENAPPGAGTRCVVDCQIEPDCVYSARRMHVEARLWGDYAWSSIEHIPRPSDQDKLESLKGERNPHGRCVWKAGCNQFDHQSVIIEFAGGATATHDLFGATSRPTRTIHIVGTKGELVGDFQSGLITVRRHNPFATKRYDEEEIDVKTLGGGGQGGHGGGDARLVVDFVRTLQGESTSKAVTRIEDSLTGHLLVFAADQSVRERRMVDLVPHDITPAASGERCPRGT